MTIDNWCIIIIGKYRDITLWNIINASCIILRYSVSSDSDARMEKILASSLWHFNYIHNVVIFTM